MALSWSNQRKFLYAGVVAVIAVAFLLVVYLQFFTTAPICFDGTLNGDEHGIDCGGSCALFCTDQARPPIVLWARVFEVGPSTYTAAAYVRNPNPGAATRDVAYSFQLFDEKNLLVTERTGTIDIPAVQTVPFIDTNINVGNRTVTHALFAFSEEPRWYKAASVPQLRVRNQYLAPDASQLSATVANDSINNVDKVTIVAVLFDADGIARAASRSVLQRVPRKGSQDVTFTWSGGVKNIIRAEITVLPSF